MYSNKIKSFTGGENGKKGENLLIRRDGRKIRLGAKTAVNINPGVRFLITDTNNAFSMLCNKLYSLTSYCIYFRTHFCY